jgi:hypothetical protein
VKQDEIIEMAREAGFNVEEGFLLRVTGIDEDLKRFAKLVANKEREAIINLIPGGFSVNPQWLCDAIRARGKT